MTNLDLFLIGFALVHHYNCDKLSTPYCTVFKLIFFQISDVYQMFVHKICFPDGLEMYSAVSLQKKKKKKWKKKS